MSDNTPHALLETTYTKENFHRKAMLLKEFFSKRFFQEHTDVPLKDDLGNFLDENNVGEALRNSLLSLPDEFFHYFTKDNINNVIKDLENEVDNRPKLTLYVPTVLPPTEVENLGKWTRGNIQENLFIDLQIDASVVGGCAFVWNGVHHDYSFKYYFDKNLAEVKNLVRSFDNGE